MLCLTAARCLLDPFRASAVVLASASDVAGSNELGTVPAGAWVSVETASGSVRTSAERVASSALCTTADALGAITCS